MIMINPFKIRYTLFFLQILAHCPLRHAITHDRHDLYSTSNNRSLKKVIKIEGTSKKNDKSYHKKNCACLYQFSINS